MEIIYIYYKMPFISIPHLYYIEKLLICFFVLLPKVKLI